MAATMEGFKAELQDMRKMVQLEETCADAATLEALKQAYRKRVRGGGAGQGAGMPG